MTFTFTGKAGTKIVPEKTLTSRRRSLRRRKLQKYDDIKANPRVLEAGLSSVDPITLNSRWSDTYFSNGNPLVLELGCGKGDYTVNLARRHRDRNFIGIDVKGDRIWYGAETVNGENIRNALFLRMQINHLEHYFPEKSVSEMWITFPDPHLKQPTRNARKRLTSPEFLERYRRVLAEDHFLHLKTDCAELYEYSLESLLAEGGTVHFHSDDIHSSGAAGDCVDISTAYERIYRYIRFSM
jgi:tRNA (guanine-N7-)-methyltransferase